MGVRHGAVGVPLGALDLAAAAQLQHSRMLEGMICLQFRQAGRPSSLVHSGALPWIISCVLLLFFVSLSSSITGEGRDCWKSSFDRVPRQSRYWIVLFLATYVTCWLRHK